LSLTQKIGQKGVFCKSLTGDIQISFDIKRVGVQEGSSKLKKHKLDRLNFFSALFSGVLLTLSFPKAGSSWLAWVALVPLLVSLRNLSPKNGFYMGLCAGLAHYLTLIYWLAYTMSAYGHLPLYASVPTLLLLSAYLALYIAVFSMTLTCFYKKPAFLVLMIPCLWVSLEYIRSFLFTGFPWGLIGYTQFNVLHLIQISDIFGVYGVSFCIALSNAAMFLAYLYLTKKGVNTRLAGGSAVTLALIFCFVWFYGNRRIHSIQKLISHSPSIKAAIVQGNIDQAKKWDPAFQRASTVKYINLSLLTKKHNPDLVVWPETATPFYFLHNARLSEMVKKGVYDTGTDFLIGSPSFNLGKNRVEYYNSAYLIGPEGTVYGKYDKAHLVPFGEYIPFKKWLPFLGKMVEGVGDFCPGKKGHAIKWKELRLGIQICYEIIFPNLSRAMVKNHASVLVNITNDAWYGKSSAPYQHFSMAVFRAVENKRSVIRAANTGISGFIDPCGKVMADTALFEDATITRSVPVIEETTFYCRFGDLFAMACLGTTLIAGFGSFFIRKYSKQAQTRVER
jgi:apolipoprotein N-acyltransferase